MDPAVVFHSQAAGPLRWAPPGCGRHACRPAGRGSPALPCGHPSTVLTPCCQSMWSALLPCPGLRADLVACDCMLTRRCLRWGSGHALLLALVFSVLPSPPPWLQAGLPGGGGAPCGQLAPCFPGCWRQVLCVLAPSGLSDRPPAPAAGCRRKLRSRFGCSGRGKTRPAASVPLHIWQESLTIR